MKKQNAGKNKKMKTVIIVIACVVAVALIAVLAVFLVKRFIGSHVADGSGMTANATSLSYQHGPDEYGNSTDIGYSKGTISYYSDDGTKKVTLSSEEQEAFLGDLEKIVSNYGVFNWTDLPKSEIEILDGATTSMTVWFDDDTLVQLGDYYEMPENGWEAVREMVDLMESYLPEN